MGLTISEFPKTLKLNNGVRLCLDKSRLLLALTEPVERKDICNHLRRAELYLEDTIDEVGGQAGRFKERVHHTPTLMWVRTKEWRPTRDNIIDQLTPELRGKLDWTGPVYQLPKTNKVRVSAASKHRAGRLALMPRVLIVKVKEPHGANNELIPILDCYNIRPQRSERLPGYFYCTLKPGMQENVWDIQQRLQDQERTLIDQVIFDFMPMLIPTGFVPPDKYYVPDSLFQGYDGQWNMWKIQAGSAPQDPTVRNSSTAWDITTGAPTVIIAVIDEGCDLTHPDLQHCWGNQPQPGATFDWDSTAEQVMFAQGGGQRGSSHGTWCTGIIAAQHNGTGVAGLAPNCQILPIRIASWRPSVVAEAIKYAADQGADVISMSFGGDATKGDYLNCPIMDTAIADAYSGNNASNKRVLLCAATMNDDQKLIYYPAAHPQVMAVGGSNINDERCTKDNWQQHLGSNYGNALSVVAPGVAIPTTSNQGRGEDYYAHFFGTSAATPHVAGLAALLISTFNDLRSNPDDVRRIIEESADKVGGTYDQRNNSWNEEMGYGRINALQALQQADREGLH